MMKEMMNLEGRNVWSIHKHGHLLVKMVAAILLFGLAFRLLVSHSVEFPLVSVLPVQDDVSSIAIAPIAEGIPDNEEGKSVKDENTRKCDLFVGDWIPNPSGPVYNNESCRVAEDHQNCMKNGRPDTNYLYWKWKPKDCDIPQFDPRIFLDSMRNKSWAFVGDSISRNHVQSLLCILSQADQVKEVYHDKEYKSKRWHFASYNFTLSVIWSPFLLKADIFEDINGVSTSEIQLYVDTLDIKWVEQYQSFDYIVIAGGKWFLKTSIYLENDTIIGCHYCPGKNLTELGFDYAYRKTLQLLFNFIMTTNHKPFVIFRTSTPDHFENGEWFSGGTCNRTVPFKEGDIQMSDIDRIIREIELDEFQRAISENNLNLKLLDTTQLSLLRPDGHPGPYRHYHPFAENKRAKVQNDCLHWCLPGPIDSWNDLLMQIVLNDSWI